MNELLAPLTFMETLGFLMKLVFCGMFYFGIERQLGMGLGATPFLVLTALAVYWKFVRHRFLP